MVQVPALRCGVVGGVLEMNMYLWAALGVYVLGMVPAAALSWIAEPKDKGMMVLCALFWPFWPVLVFLILCFDRD